MHDDRERVDRLLVHEDIELDQRRFPVAGHMIVERPIAPGDRFETVVEIEDDLVERQLVRDEHAVRCQVLEALLDAALLLAEFQDPADVG